MGLQMGPGGSATLSREAKRSVSSQEGRRWLLRDLTENRGEENRQSSWETQLGGLTPSSEGRLEMRGLWAACQTVCPRDTSPHPAPLLTVFQRPVPGMPCLKGSSSLSGSCPQWAGEQLQGSRQRHEPPRGYIWGCGVSVLWQPQQIYGNVAYTA